MQSSCLVVAFEKNEADFWILEWTFVWLLRGRIKQQPKWKGELEPQTHSQPSQTIFWTLHTNVRRQVSWCSKALVHGIKSPHVQHILLPALLPNFGLPHSSSPLGLHTELYNLQMGYLKCPHMIAVPLVTNPPFGEELACLSKTSHHHSYLPF